MGATWPTRPLTPRELQVLTGAANGKQNSEIGDELYITEDTVKTHMRTAFKTLGARDRAHAVAIALTMGLLPVTTVQIPGVHVMPHREQQLLTLLLGWLGREVCLRLVDGRLVHCELAAILPDGGVGVFECPFRTQRRYRIRDIRDVVRQEIQIPA